MRKSKSEKDYKEYTYFCGYCNRYFKNVLAFKKDGSLIKGQKVKCPKCKNFIPTMDFM